MDLFRAAGAPCIDHGEVARSIPGDRSKPLACRPKLSEDVIKVYGEALALTAAAKAIIIHDTRYVVHIEKSTGF